MDETFKFKIEAWDVDTNKAITDGSVPLPAETEIELSGAGDTAFGDITYSDTGIYIYKISEIAGTSTEYDYDDTVYYVHVTVKNTNGVLSAVTAYYKNTYGVMPKPTTLTFTNKFTFTPGSLSLSKTVTGELGSYNKVFTFDVTLSDTDYTADFGAKGSITGGSGEIKLKHGESVSFLNLKAGTTYTITEAATTGYITSIMNGGTAVTPAEGEDSVFTATGTVSTKSSVAVDYTNDASYTPPTGTVSNSVPFILIAVVALGAIVTPVIIHRRKTLGL